MSQSAADTVWLVETPEGIDLQTELAGPMVRGVAYTLDLLIRGLLMVLVGIPLAMTGEGGMGIWLIFAFLLDWFYPVLFEVYRQGQTPGKKWLGIAAVNDDLTPIQWGSSMIRNLLRWVDFLPGLWLGGLLSMTLSGKFQRLGDYAAGTLVVYRGERQTPPLSTDVDASSPPISPPVSLTADEQVALVAFAQRASGLSEQRQAELASFLPALMGSGGSAVTRLQGMGRWLLGERR